MSARCDKTELLQSECAHCGKLPDLGALASDFVPGRKSKGTVVEMAAASIGTLSVRMSPRRVRASSSRGDYRKARDLNKGFAIEAHKAFLETRIAQWQARIEAAIEGGADKDQVRLARVYLAQQKAALKAIA